MLQMAKEHWQAEFNPQTAQQIEENRKIRQKVKSTFYLTSELDESHIPKIEKFWSTQAYFLIQSLRDNYKSYLAIKEKTLRSKEKDLKEKDSKEEETKLILSKKNLIAIFNTLVDLLKDQEYQQSIIDLFVDSAEVKPKKTPLTTDKSSTKPILLVQPGDSIGFAYDLAIAGEEVLIMDASNAVRPGGDSAFATGTFQEALARCTNLYSQSLLNFRDVTAALEEEKVLRPLQESSTKSGSTGAPSVSKQAKPINVLSFKARYLQSILHFVVKSMQDRTYLKDIKKFRKEFFEYADSIYPELQNTVYEILVHAGGFINRVRMMDLADIKATADLFDEEGTIKADLLDVPTPYIYVAEVAAPDRRDGYTDAHIAEYDSMCSFSGKLGKTPNALLATAFNYVLDQKPDNIILNGFGCGAFKNSPEVVAKILANVLESRFLEQAGKTFYFKDKDEGRCKQFSEILEATLKYKFDVQIKLTKKVAAKPALAPGHKDNFLNISCGKNILQILLGQLPSTVPPEELQVCHQRNKFSTRFLGADRPVGSFLAVPETMTQESKLVDIYKDLVDKAYQSDKIGLYIFLIGTGKLHFSVEDSFKALRQVLSARKEYPIRVCLYIEKQSHYDEIVELLKPKVEEPKGVRVIFS